MRAFNFVSTISHEKKQFIGRWIFLTALVGCLMIGIFCIFYILQWRTLQNLSLENHQLSLQLTSYSQAVIQMEPEVTQTKVMLQKVCKINTYQHAQSSLIIEWLAKETATTPIQQLSIDKKNMRMEMLCTQTDQALDFITRLQKNSWCLAAETVSFKTTSDRKMLVTITCKLK